MGYTTDFNGSFQLDKPLTSEHKTYLERFANVRHMKRDPKKLEEIGLLDPARIAVGLPLGPDCCFYAGEDDGESGQTKDASIVDYNSPPGWPENTFQMPKDNDFACPGLWLQWVPNEEGDGIEWDGGEKFYYYVAWLEFIIRHFLKPWGYVLNGEVKYRGEEGDSDTGYVMVKDNMVSR